MYRLLAMRVGPMAVVGACTTAGAGSVLPGSGSGGLIGHADRSVMVVPAAEVRAARPSGARGR